MIVSPGSGAPTAALLVRASALVGRAWRRGRGEASPEVMGAGRELLRLADAVLEPSPMNGDEPGDGLALLADAGAVIRRGASLDPDQLRRGLRHAAALVDECQVSAGPGDPPRAARDRLLPGTPLWLAARIAVAERIGEFYRHLDQSAVSDAEAIHDLRVGSRRLREGLDLFAPCYRRKELKRVLKRVKRVTRELGNLRNADEAILFFQRLGNSPGKALSEGSRELARHYAEARGVEMVNLSGFLLNEVPRRGGLERMVARPELFRRFERGGSPFMPLGTYASRVLKARGRRVASLVPGAMEEREQETQHRLRIAVKHCRYAVEILAPLYGEAARKVVRSLKEYQDVLGSLHDIDVFREAVPGVVAGAPRSAVMRALTRRRKGLHRAFLGLCAAAPIDTLLASLEEHAA